MAASLDIAEGETRSVSRAASRPRRELAAFKERRIRLLGRDLNYVDEGKGDVLIFLHNGGGFWQCWSHQLMHFAKTHRVLALDWPGFGESASSDELPTLHLYTDTLTALVDALKLDSFVLVGNCIGASLAIRYQNLHPEKVRGLVLMNICPGRRLIRFRPARIPLFHMRNRAFRNALRRTINFVITRKMVMRKVPGILFGGPMPDDDPLVVHYRRKFREDSITNSRTNLLFAVDTFTLRDFIEPNDMIRNALLIWGRDNWVAPLKSQGHFHQEACEIGRIEVIPGAGHLTMYEAPEQVNALIEGYLARLRPRLSPPAASPGSSAP